MQRTGNSDSAVVGWGRGMGHRGHMYLASSVITHANQTNSDPYFVVSRTFGKDDPLPPEEKLNIYKKVFPKYTAMFFSATEDMNGLPEVLHQLYELQYKNVTVILGADQVSNFKFLKNYNNKPDKRGNILYAFDTLNVISRQETADPSNKEEGPRATPMREILKNPDATPDEQFKVWRDAMSSEISDIEVRRLMNLAKRNLAESYDKPEEKVESFITDPEEKARIGDIKKLIGMFGSLEAVRRARYFDKVGLLKATPKQREFLLRMTDENGVIKPRQGPDATEHSAIIPESAIKPFDSVKQYPLTALISGYGSGDKLKHSPEYRRERQIQRFRKSTIKRAENGYLDKSDDSDWDDQYEKIIESLMKNILTGKP